MYYEFEVTTPKNTASASPLRTRITLAPGVIRYVEVQFPRGCVGLVHAKILDELHQVWPANPDGDLSSENARIAWREQWELTNAENELLLVTWNDDDSYSHTLRFRFELLELHLWRRQEFALSALDYLAQWFTQAPVGAQQEG